MSTRIRRTLLCACLAALALPATAGAGAIAPPGSEAEEGFSTAARAAADPGCRAKSVIAFRGEARFKVRHLSMIRCTNVRVRINCRANLLHGTDSISRLRSNGRDRCRVGTPFAQSDRYEEGEPFTQRYRYKLTLRNRRQHWSGTTRKCPKRSNERRTLTCRSSHTTVAPRRSVDKISS